MIALFIYSIPYTPITRAKHANYQLPITRLPIYVHDVHKLRTQSVQITNHRARPRTNHKYTTTAIPPDPSTISITII
jgi:hypothetical protein